MCLAFRLLDKSIGQWHDSDPRYMSGQLLDVRHLCILWYLEFVSHDRGGPLPLSQVPSVISFNFCGDLQNYTFLETSEYEESENV